MLFAPGGAEKVPTFETLLSLGAIKVQRSSADYIYSTQNFPVGCDIHSGKLLLPKTLAVNADQDKKCSVPTLLET